MQVALIPPTGLETWALRSGFHLTLPHMFSNLDYRATYIRAAQRGDYIVLDNGEAEGVRVTGLNLRKMALEVEANEVVAPDIIGDKAKTCAAVHQFFRHAEGETSKEVDAVVRYMAVVQGQNMAELKACVEYYAGIPKIRVLGIPRHLLVTIEQSSVRIDLANWIRDFHFGRFEIHLLGTSPSWIQEVRYASKYAPHIRSVDTSMPFNYAIAGIPIQHDTRKTIPRPLTYFTKDHSTLDTSLIKYNVDRLLEWAGV